MTPLRDNNVRTQPFTAAENRVDGQMRVQILSLALSDPKERGSGQSGTNTYFLEATINSEPNLGGPAGRLKGSLSGLALGQEDVR